MTATDSPLSWSSIPNKAELAIICSIRMADFFQQAALQAVMFYQLSSFAPKASESDISFQVGVLQGAFTAAQIFMALVWGKVADHPSFGRKRVILISLIGQGISCLGVAFSRSFAAAVIWRALGGAVNASVGGARTALSEKTEKKYHSRTFLLLPLAWNLAQISGPPIAGFLSDPVKYHPRLFGERSSLGGQTGVIWLKAFPYAPPSLGCALVLFADALLVWIGLEETLHTRLGKRDRGLEFLARLKRCFTGAHTSQIRYTILDDDEDSLLSASENLELQTNHSSPRTDESARLADSLPLDAPLTGKPPFLKALTTNVLRVMSTVAFFDFGIGGFAALWTMFLSTERYGTAKTRQPNLPFHFTGGLGFSPPIIGLAMSIFGMVGVICQLTLYPRVSGRWGVLKSTKYALFLFPVAHALAPFLSLVFNRYLLWLGIVGIGLINITARTFTTPGMVLLINNSSPNPQVLGTIHGLGASVQAAARTFGPMVVGWWYSDGIRRGMVGEAWWLLAGFAMLGCVPIFWVRDGYGD